MSYASASGMSGSFPLPEGNITIIARLTETRGGGTSVADFKIPVVVVALTQGDIDIILSDPAASLKEAHLSTDAVVLKYMAAGGSVGNAASRRRHRRVLTGGHLAHTMQERSNLLSAIIAELDIAVAGSSLTAELAGRLLTAMADNVGGGSPVPITPASATLAAGALEQLAASGLLTQASMLPFAMMVNNVMASFSGDTADTAYRTHHMPALLPAVLPKLPGNVTAGMGTNANQTVLMAALLGAMETAIAHILAGSGSAQPNQMISVSNYDATAATSRAEFDYVGGRADCNNITDSLTIGGAENVVVTVPRERFGCTSDTNSGITSNFSLFRFDKDPHRWLPNGPTSTAVSFAVGTAKKSQPAGSSGCYKVAFVQAEKADENRSYTKVHRLLPHSTLVLTFDRTQVARQQAVQIVVEPFTVVKNDRAQTKVAVTVTGHLHVKAGVGGLVSPVDASPFDYSFNMSSNRVSPASLAKDISDPSHVLQIVPGKNANRTCNDAKTAADPYESGTAEYVLALETSSEEAVDVLIRIWHEECVSLSATDSITSSRTRRNNEGWSHDSCSVSAASTPGQAVCLCDEEGTYGHVEGHTIEVSDYVMTTSTTTTTPLLLLRLPPPLLLRLPHLPPLLLQRPRVQPQLSPLLLIPPLSQQPQPSPRRPRKWIFLAQVLLQRT